MRIASTSVRHSKNLVRFASYIPKGKNYYQILGVSTDATKEQIKQAFIEKTNQLHPDRQNVIDDSRVGWSRENSTEKFMMVKEAYDCLRNVEKRKSYDEEILLVSGEGFLMEVKNAPFTNTILDLNKRRNESYSGPGKKTESAAHFRNPEEEYYAEKRKNYSLYLIGALFLSIVGVNITYVWYLRRIGQKRIIL